MRTLFSIAKDDPRVLHLQQQDPRLQRLIQLIGPLETHQRTDRFDSLVRAIIGQQLSVKDVLSLGDAGLRRAARWVYGGVGEEL